MNPWVSAAEIYNCTVDVLKVIVHFVVIIIMATTLHLGRQGVRLKVELCPGVGLELCLGVGLHLNLLVVSS